MSPRGERWPRLDGGFVRRSSGFLHRREASRLTAREREVVLLICGGLKNKQIAEKLGITPGTVKVHLMHIFEKTGMKDRFALAVAWPQSARDQSFGRVTAGQPSGPGLLWRYAAEFRFAQFRSAQLRSAQFRSEHHAVERL